MKTRREELVAMAALAIATGSPALAAPKKGPASVECFAVNTCKGTNGCGIGTEQIDVANKAFAKRFAKAKPIDCAGNSDCSAKGGFLAWVSKSTSDECFKAGGFLFEKGADGKLVVKDKDGVKKS